MPDALDAFLDAPDVEERDALDAFLDEPEPEKPRSEPEPTTLNYLHQAMTGLGTGAARSVAGTLEALGYASHLTGAIDPENPVPLEENPIYGLGQRIRRNAENVSVVHPALKDSGTKRYSEMTGQLVGDVAGAGKLTAAMRAAGIGAKTARYGAPAIQFGGQGVARGVESAREVGADEDATLQSAAAQGAISAATGPLGATPRWVARLAGHTGSGVIRKGMDALVDGGLEAFQETAETLASAYADKQILDKDRELYRELVEGARDGGIMGVAASLVFSALGGKRGSAPQDPQTDQPTLEQPERVPAPIDETPSSPDAATDADAVRPEYRERPEEWDLDRRAFIEEEIARRLTERAVGRDAPESVVPASQETLHQTQVVAQPVFATPRAQDWPALDEIGAQSGRATNTSQTLANRLSVARSEPSAIDGERQAPTGFVRLYHGASKTAGQAGRDFTPFREYAQGYADKSQDGEVWYVDVPQGSVKTHDEYGVPLSRVIVPDEIADRAKPLRAQVSREAYRRLNRQDRPRSESPPLHPEPDRDAQNTGDQTQLPRRDESQRHSQPEPTHFRREEQNNNNVGEPSARSVDPNTGVSYGLSDDARNSFEPNREIAERTAVAALAKAIERDPVRRARRRDNARLEPVRYTPHQAASPEISSAELLGQLHGHKPVWFRNVSGESIDGAFFNGKLFLSVEMNGDPAVTVTAHELIHAMRKEAPDIYTALEQEIVRLSEGRTDAYDANRMGRGYEARQIREEHVADFAGETLANPRKLQEALRDNPTLFERIVTFMRDFLDRIKRKLAGQGNSPTARDTIRRVEKAEQALNQDLREWRATRKASMPPDSRGERSDDRQTVEREGVESAKIGAAQPEPNEPSLSRQQPREAAIQPQAPTNENVGGVLEWLRNVVMPPKQTGLPVVNYDNDNPLPDFHEYAKSKAIFSQGWGAETFPVLGKLYGGRFNARDPITKAVAAWHGEQGVGKAIASALGVELGGTINKPFKVSKTGDIDVQTTQEGQSKKIGDVFEALRRDPNAYKLTPEQQKAWDQLKPLLDRMTELKRQYGLIGQPTDFFGEDSIDAYFPRIVTKEPRTKEAPRQGGSRVGAKQGFQKERAFRTEAEGWRRGYQYETDIEARLVRSAERMYRAIADKRLAADPELGGRTRKGLISELLDSYNEEIIEGRMTADEVIRIADGIESKGRVHQPAFAKKIFDPDVADTLNKAFPSGPTANAVVKTNNFVKAIALGFDLGVSRIQGITLLLSSVRHPSHGLIWAKSEIKALQALVDKRTLSKYARQNQQVIRELAQHGSSVGELQEMLAGLEKGQLIHRIPVVGTLGKAFGRNFQTFLDISKIEMYKSWRRVAEPNELPEIAQAIESMLGGARMEAIGLSRRRILAERGLLLAPSYYRAAVNLIGGLAEKGTSGRIARDAMAGYLMGGTLLFYGMAKALEMEDDEILRRLNPMDRQFMKWRVRMADGKEVNLGIGGIFRSVIRLFGQIATTSIEHPENWKSLTAAKNPIVSWLRAHGSPVVGFAWDNLSGEDFLGRPVDLSRSVEPLMPMFIRPALSKVEKVPGTALEYTSSFFGVSGYGMTPEDQVKRLASEFKREIGIPPKARGTYQESEFRNLEWALRNNDVKAIRKEHALLLKNMEGAPHKEPAKKRIFDHFKRRGEYRFTGSEEREKRFLASLTPEQKQLYWIAKRENQALVSRLRDALTQ